MTNKKYDCVSFFAGVGGIDLGFQQAGPFRTIYANEFDPYPVKTYELNFPILVDNRDIRTVVQDMNSIPSFDVMLAGFPCQAFSVAGYRQGFNDKKGRGTLFFELAKIIHARKPEVIMLENVKNLVTHDHGNTFKVILQTLKNEGYTVKWKVMNAMKYGNIPQNRERIYIVCFKNEKIAKKFSFPDEIPLTTKLSDIIDYHGEKEEKYYYRKGKYKEGMYEELEKAVISQNSVYQWRRHYVRENKSSVVPTLTAGMGMGGHNVPIILTDGGIRKLTPRECFNVQGFPKDFLLPENMVDSRLYKQAGNSVCVSVIKRIAEEIEKAMM